MEMSAIRSSCSTFSDYATSACIIFCYLGESRCRKDYELFVRGGKTKSDNRTGENGEAESGGGYEVAADHRI